MNTLDDKVNICRRKQDEYMREHGEYMRKQCEYKRGRVNI